MKFLAALYAKAVQVGIRNAKRMAVATIAVLLLSVPLFSQITTGTIQGSVFDQTGGAIAGATVTVVDVARGISRPLITDSAGQYVALNLAAGTYTVRGEAKGFQTLERANILVEVGQNYRIDLTLQPGAQTQTVTVTEAVPAINTADAVLGGTVSNQEVNALPLNGRNFLRMLDLRPGAVINLGGGEGIGNTDTTSFNGLRVQDNLYVIEGLPQFAPAGSSEITFVSIDAIQEINQALNPKAEYGWKDGGVTDVGIKSGTNSLHGTLFAFGRDQSLDASNYFAGLIPLAMQQFGGQVGGRIIKDKLFWFASFEDQRYQVGTGVVPTIPSDMALSSALDPNNQLSMINACNAVTSTVHGATTGPYNAIGVAGTNGTLTALSAQLAGLSVNSSTGCAVTPASSTFENVFPTNNSTSLFYNPNLIDTTQTDAGIGKLDYHMSDQNHFSVAYYRDQGISTSYGSGYGARLTPFEPGWALVSPNTTTLLSATWTWTPNSVWANEARGGRAALETNPRHLLDSNLPSAPWPTGYGLPTGVTNPLYGGLPTMTIGGFSGQLGAGSFGGTKGPEGNIDVVDHVSYLHGKHAIKFGAEYIYEIFVGNTFKNAQGTIAFSNLQNFLQGIPQSGSVFEGNAALDAGNHNFGGFIQDDWRVTNKLILNLGLRYEYGTGPVEKNNYIGNFYPNVNPLTTSALGQAGGPFTPLYKSDATQFSPRFGMAWDVKGNGRTVVRVAAGLLYAIAAIGDSIDVNPFGANVPSIGYNTSGTPINLASPTNFAVSVSQIQNNWNTTGPILVPSGSTVGGITYTGVTCTAPNATVNGVANSGSPCDPIAISPTMKTPDIAEWNIELQHAITNSLSLSVAYVGNHGYDELDRNDVNQPPFGWGWNSPAATSLPGGVTPAACVVSGCATYKTILAAVAANEQVGEPYFSKFPYLQYITTQQNQFYSDYDGLQVSAAQRVTRGLTFNASFTHDRALDFVNSGGWAGPYSQDNKNVKADYGPGGLDVKNRFTLTATYNLPGIKTPGQMLQGWVVNGIFVAQGGIPWNPQDLTNDLEGTGEQLNPNSASSQYWNYSGPPSAFTSAPANIPCFGAMSGCTPYAGGVPPAACVSAAQAPYAGNAQLQALALAALKNTGCYVQGLGVLTPPAYGTIGDANRGIFHTVPYYNVDFSIFKEWKYRERYTAQFRAEFFNIFNTADFASPPKIIDPGKGAGFGCSCATPDANGGGVVFGAGGARVGQFGLKLIF